MKKPSMSGFDVIVIFIFASVLPSMPVAVPSHFHVPVIFFAMSATSGAGLGISIFGMSALVLGAGAPALGSVLGAGAPALGAGSPASASPVPATSETKIASLFIFDLSWGLKARALYSVARSA